MSKKTKGSGGGRLSRSETVTIRLDPKLNYLAEIAARAQRRTKSSLIEAALADSLNIIRVDLRPSANDNRTIAEIAEKLWHVNEAERLRRLVGFAPHLLTFDEQQIWAVLTKHLWFWLGEWKTLDQHDEFYFVEHTPDKLWMTGVEQWWTNIKRVAEGETPSEPLPTYATRRPKSGMNPLLQLSNDSPSAK